MNPLDTNPPNSIEAERGLIGSVLIGGADAVDPAVDLGLTADDFFRRTHAVIWDAITYLYDNRKPIDIITVAERIDEKGNWPESDNYVRTYLSGITNDVPTYTHAGYYAKIVRDKAVRRHLLGAAGQIAAVAYDESNDIDATLDKAEAALKKTKDKAPSTGRVPTPDDIIARMEGEKSTGVPTRWAALNAVSTGMVRGHLWVIGGFSSTGKTAVMVNLLEDVVRAGGAALVASTEMSQEQYMLRLLSISSRVPQRTIRHGGMNMEQHGAYGVARDFWKGAKVRIHDDLYNVTRIRRMARKAKEQMGSLDVIFVDFIQNLNETNTNDEVKDARAAAIQLQQLAKDMNCCVVALSQISNAQAMQQQESGAMGNYYSFKGSGAIKDAADLAIMLDRDRVNKPDVMWFNVVKNRHDSLTRFAGRFDLDTGRIDQMTAEEAADSDPNSGRKSRRKKEDDGY